MELVLVVGYVDLNHAVEGRGLNIRSVYVSRVSLKTHIA
jgi:hypothetical protein